MDTSFFTTPQQIAPEQIETVNDRFDYLLYDPATSFQDEVFVALDRFFYGPDGYKEEAIAAYHHTYWRWYVEICWKMLYSHSNETATRVIVRQFSTAYMMGIDVEEKFFNYLDTRIPSKENLLSFDKDIVAGITQAAFMLNPVSKETLSSSALLRAFRAVENKSSVDRASFLARVQRALFPEDNLLVWFNAQEQADITTRVVGFIDLFSKPHDIEQLLGDYLNDLLGKSLLRGIDVDVFFNEDAIDLTEVVKTGNNNAPRPTTETAVTAAPTSESAEFHLSSVEAKKMVEEMLGKDATPDAILEKLEELAEQYNDNTIRGLYYFDQQQGTFLWDSES